MVTIAAPRAWALGTLRQRSWMSHVLTVGTWPWQCCAPDTSSLDVGVSPLLCPVLVPPDGGLLGLRARVIWGSQWELPRRVRLRGPLTPRAHRTVWGSRMSIRGPRTGRGPASHSVAPADDGISITASGDELGSGEDDSAALPPSGRVALPESDPELTAMLPGPLRASGCTIGVRRLPSARGWMIGSWGRRPNVGNRPRFRSSRKCMRRWTRSWKAPFSARNRPSASSVLTTLDGGAAQGYVEVPPVERAIAMQLCPQGAAAWRGNPRLPSRACKFSSALTAKAYGAAGQAASALHAMALLQVHQAKALKQLHEGDADPGVLQELRTATDLALRATKVTARALGQTMSTLVVQERHLWLTLADMRESDKHRFLDSPISQAGLLEDFAQQFSAAQKQTEAFRHILPRWSAAVSTPPPAAAPPSARRRGRPPAASTSAPARPQQQPALRPQRGAGRRRPAQPASAPAKPVKRQGRQRPWDGRPGAFGSCSSGDGDRTTPSPGGGPGGESFVSFLFCSATDPQVSVTPHTQTPLRDALPFESGHCAPFRCPTVGTAVTPLVPLVRSLGAWLELPRPSRWLLRGLSDSATRFSSPGVPPS